ncbi:MAG: glycosyltransferase [Acidobacteriota bacterium]
MTPRFQLLTGEYPPQPGGVADYTRLVAAGLVARGAEVHVWCPGTVDRNDDGVQVHRLPDVFGPRSRRALEAALEGAPGCVLLQYVPNALGSRGGNLAFCVWLLRMRRRGLDIRVMFHEPYFYFSLQRPARNALALVQRLMAALLLRASPVAYVSTSAWLPYLRPWGGRTLIELPVPATVGTAAADSELRHWRAAFRHDAPGACVAGHFGTFGEHMTAELLRVVPAVLRAAPAVRFALIGRGADGFVEMLVARDRMLASRVVAAAALPPGAVPAALQACDILVQPYPDGVTTRRTSVMAALANERPVVTTDGALTEPIWRGGAVALAPAGDAAALAAAAARLLEDAAARHALGALGRHLYDTRFGIAHTLDVLAGAVSAA